MLRQNRASRGLIKRVAVFPLVFVGFTDHAFSQTPARDAGAVPTFAVVSIKRNTASFPFPGPLVERPDGGLSFLAYDGDPSGGSKAHSTLDQRACVGPHVEKAAGTGEAILACASMGPPERVCQ